MEGRPRLAGLAHRPEPGHDDHGISPCCAPRPARCPPMRGSSSSAGGSRPTTGRCSRRSRELSGGRVAVLPTASGEPREAGEETRDSFRAYGIASEVVRARQGQLSARPRSTPKLVALLERYGSFYFTGGDQALIVQALIQDGKPTPALAAIRRRLGGGRAGLGQQCRCRDHERPHDHQRQLGRGPGPSAGRRAARHQAQHRRAASASSRSVWSTSTSCSAGGWGGWWRRCWRPAGRHGFGIDENTAMVIAGGRLTRAGRDRADPRRRLAAHRQAGGRGSGRAQAQLSRSRRQPGSRLAQGAAGAGQAAGPRPRALLPRAHPGRQGGLRRLHHARDPGPAGRGRPRALPQRDHLGLRPCQRQRGRGRDQPRTARQGADRAWRPGPAGDGARLRSAPARALRQQCGVLPQPGAGRHGRARHGGRGRPAGAAGQPAAGRLRACWPSCASW